MGVNGEAFQLHAVYKKPYFYYKSCQSLYQVLQVMHTTSERALKSQYQAIPRKTITCLLPLALLLMLLLVPIQTATNS